MQNIIKERKIEITEVTEQRSRNKSAIDYVLEYTQDIKSRRNLNYVRLYKMVYLPIELVGPNRGQAIDCYALREDTSMIDWNINNKIETEPNQK